MAAECELQSTHPIAHSIVKEARRRGFELEQPESIEEIAGKGIRVSKDNAEILCGNRELLEMYQISIIHGRLLIIWTKENVWYIGQIPVKMHW